MNIVRTGILSKLKEIAKLAMQREKHATASSKDKKHKYYYHTILIITNIINLPTTNNI